MSSRYTGPGRRDEQGIALITVVILISILSVLLAAVAEDAIASMSTSRFAQDWTSALGAAQAGESDFLYRLNAQESSSYCVAQVVQSDAPGQGACAPVSQVPPATGPSGWVAEPNAAPNSLTSCYQYRIPSKGLVAGSANNSSVASAIVLDVLGKMTTGSCSNAARTQRSIRVTLTRTTYLNYGYFTDRETQDPAQYGTTLSSEFANVTNAQGVVTNAQNYANQYCSNYYFALSTDNLAALGKSPPPANYVAPVSNSDIRAGHSSVGSYTTYTTNNICTYTRFGGGDYFDGPVHTNDVFQFGGAPTFVGPVTVSHDSSGNCTPGYIPGANDGDGVLWVDASQAIGGPAGTFTPNSGTAGVPAHISCVAPIPYPTFNSSLLTQAQNGGCAYSGITYLYFEASGKIDVYSPGTPPASVRQGCPLNGQLDPSHFSPGNFNGSIYVSNLANSAACTLSTAAIAPPASPGPGMYGNSLGRIIQDNDLNELVNEDVGNANQSTWGSTGVKTTAYDCHNGDAFVGGTLNGQLTVGADNNAVIYQGLSYAGETGSNPAVDPAGTSVLGLEPKQSVQMYHPVSCPAQNNLQAWTTATVAANTEPAYSTCANGTVNLLPTTCSVPVTTSPVTNAACQANVVQAAILCLSGEYTAENWAYGGSLGTLHTTGSVTQRYRGRLAATTGSSGYSKSYVYDSRLATITPPYFLPPNVFSWSQASFADTTADTSN